MKSIKDLIVESKNSFSFKKNDTPKWDKLTIGVDPNNDLRIIIGEPATQSDKEKYDEAYELASKIFGHEKLKNVPKTIAEVIKRAQVNEPELLDPQRKFCITYSVDAEGYCVVYDYEGENGVVAITNK